MFMTMVLRRMKFGAVTGHEMRSRFRNHMGDVTDHLESIVEQALAQQIGDERPAPIRTPALQQCCFGRLANGGLTK